MKYLTKFILISAVVFVLKTISICTPDWIVYNICPTVPIQTITDHARIKSNSNGMPTVTQTKGLPSVTSSGYDISGAHLYIQQGLWYRISCEIKSFVGEEWTNCKYGTYESGREILNYYHSMINSENLFQASQQFTVIEFQIETTTGIILLLIATIMLAALSKGWIKNKVFGHVSCLFYLLSGVLYWVAVGKTFLLMSETSAGMRNISDKVKFELGVPWSATVAAIGGTMSLGIALGLLVVMAGNYEEWRKLVHNKNGIFYTVVISDYEKELKPISPPAYDEKA